MQSTGLETKSTENMLWDTQAGSFTTDATVKLENYCLPQFSMEDYEHPSDHYDFIIGCDVLFEIELDFLYSSKKFAWNDIMIDMVPKGHWNRFKIKKFWTSYKEETCLAPIKSAE